MKNLFKPLLLSSIISFNSFAGQIDTNNITTFTPGSVISSSEVNTAVNEVVTQVNDNHLRIAALEKKLTPTISTVAGTYSYITFDQLLHDTGQDVVENTNTDFTFRIKNFTSNGTITFDGNGTITSDTFNEFKSHMVAVKPSSIDKTNINNVLNDVATDLGNTGSTVTIYSASSSGTGIYSPFSYQVANGNLIIDLGVEAGCSGYVLKGPISVDGNIIVLQANDVCTSGSITYTNTQQTTMILIKQAP